VIVQLSNAPHTPSPEPQTTPPASIGAISAISLKIDALVQGYTRATFSVVVFLDALATTLSVPTTAVTVLSVKDLLAQRRTSESVRVVSLATFPSGHYTDAETAAAQLSPEVLTRNLRAGGLTLAKVMELVATITNPAVSALSPETTPMISQTFGRGLEAAVTGKIWGFLVKPAI
jgi:hypothetical protein